MCMTVQQCLTFNVGYILYDRPKLTIQQGNVNDISALSERLWLMHSVGQLSLCLGSGIKLPEIGVHHSGQEEHKTQGAIGGVLCKGSQMDVLFGRLSLSIVMYGSLRHTCSL